MRKDNAIFFAGGLVFGLLLGYFVFAAVSQTPGGFSSLAGPAGALGPSGMGGATSQPAQQAMSRRVLDPQEVAALQNMIQQNPDDNESRVRLGNLYLESGHDDQAVPLFHEVLDRESGNNHARLHLAQTLANLGRLDEAVAEYDTVLANEPGNPQALLGLGRVRLYAQQDITAGLEAWEELMRVAPNSREAESIRDELEALKSAHAIN
ncbi:MAG TPA: tetratricopeptide repeat protein [Vicinamibacteria bacterium]|jgi:tetratricopeptide (TPR) repeat protein